MIRLGIHTYIHTYKSFYIRTLHRPIIINLIYDGKIAIGECWFGYDNISVWLCVRSRANGVVKITSIIYHMWFPPSRNPPPPSSS